jgi:hypothetical protein
MTIIFYYSYIIQVQLFIGSQLVWFVFTKYHWHDPNNSCKSITNTTWVCARLCKLQKRVHLTCSRKFTSCLPMVGGSLRVLWLLPALKLVFGGVRLANLFSFMCFPIKCFYVLSFVFWCPLRFPHKNDVRSVFACSCLQEGSCHIYVCCACLCIVVSNTYCPSPGNLATASQVHTFL